MKTLLLIAVIILMIALVMGRDIINFASGRVVVGCITAILVGIGLLVLFGGTGTFMGELALIIGLIIGFIIGYFLIEFFKLIKGLLSLLWHIAIMVANFLPWWGKAAVCATVVALAKKLLF